MGLEGCLAPGQLQRVASGDSCHFPPLHAAHMPTTEENGQRVAISATCMVVPACALLPSDVCATTTLHMSPFGLHSFSGMPPHTFFYLLCHPHQRCNHPFSPSPSYAYPCTFQTVLCTPTMPSPSPSLLVPGLPHYLIS